MTEEELERFREGDPVLFELVLTRDVLGWRLRALGEGARRR